MLKSSSGNQFDKRIIKEYIVKQYLFRQDDIKSLCFDDDDQSENNLHSIFVGLNQNQKFENKIIDLIEISLRVNKYDKLVILLQQKNPRFDFSIREITNPTFSSPPTKDDLGPHSPRTKQLVKQGKFEREARPATTQPAMYTGQDLHEEFEIMPQIERLHQDIEGLEKNMGSLGEIDALLQAISKKIGELLLDIKVKHQMMQNERLISAKKSKVFQREQKEDFQVSKAGFVRGQPYSSPSSGWRDTSYSKPS